MNRNRLLVGWTGRAAAVVAVLALAACNAAQSLPDDSLRIGTTLAPCGLKGTEYEKMPYREWATAYHSGVSAVIDAHLLQLGAYAAEVGNANTPLTAQAKPLDCTKIDAQSQPPTAALVAMASKLPPWKDADRLASLSRGDTAAVLLENLRTYRCALKDAQFFDVIRADSALRDTNGSAAPVTWYNLVLEASNIRSVAEEEQTVSREALNRTLMLIAGFDRVGMFRVAMECLARTSLDLRNTLGLLTEAGACLPGIQDKKNGLRDFQAFDREDFSDILNGSTSSTPDE